MKKIVRLTENDLERIIKRVISEQPVDEFGSDIPNKETVIGELEEMLEMYKTNSSYDIVKMSKELVDFLTPLSKGGVYDLPRGLEKLPMGKMYN